MTRPDSIQSWIEHEEQMDRRAEALERALLIDTPEPVFCAVCYSTQETVMRDRELGIGEVCCVLEDEQEPPCECVQIDVDQDDARFCRLHGPHSESARREREQEAADLAAYYIS